MRITPRTLLLIVILLLPLAACAPAETPVTGTERTTVLQFAEPMTDAQLAAIASGDYAAFVANYDDAMKKATTEASFQQLRTLLSSKVGAYQSRTVDSVTLSQGFYIVTYSAKFSEDTVSMRMVFENGGDHLIAGLWLNSPKLRQ
jgi:hypothetical protein